MGSKKKKKKHEDDRDYHIDYKKARSDATIEIDEIENFVYGPSGCRFWMARKHINSTELKYDPMGKLLTKLPFYTWECLSLQTKDRKRTIDLIIPQEHHMMIVLHFLILQMKTVDGVKNSAIPYLEYRLKQ
jgi:hypothetical protein